jgi:hypothetical protein
MIDGEYANLLVDELMRLFSGTSDWHATLLKQSSVGLMDELTTAGAQRVNGILSNASFDDVKNQAEQQIRVDPGLGLESNRNLILSQIPRKPEEFAPTSYKFKTWASMTPDLNQNYISNWRKEFSKSIFEDSNAPLFRGSISAHESAALLAAHLFHVGLSRGYLSRWFSYRTKVDSKKVSLDELMEQLEDLLRNGFGRTEILAIVAKPPQESLKTSDEWITTIETRRWLGARGFSAPKTLHGGLIFVSEEWDIAGAVLNVSRAIHRLRQRATLKNGKAPAFLPTVWIDGVKNPWALPNTTMLGTTLMPAYEIGVPSVATPDSNNRLEVAVELLLAGLNELGPSVAGTLWASLEALLAAPGDQDKMGVVNRAADIALVALIRSSIQSSLGLLLSRCSGEPLTVKLDGLSEELRLYEFEEALRKNEHLSIPHHGVRVVLSHTRFLFEVKSIQLKLEEIRMTLRGLYRHRNLVLHGGVTDGPLLEDVLRASVPLSTAVINRYAGARNETGIDPHRFAFEMHKRILSYCDNPVSIVEAMW